jgi:hypothetical protein
MKRILFLTAVAVSFVLFCSCDKEPSKPQEPEVPVVEPNADLVDTQWVGYRYYPENMNPTDSEYRRRYELFFTSPTDVVCCVLIPREDMRIELSKGTYIYEPPTITMTMDWGTFPEYSQFVTVEGSTMTIEVFETADQIGNVELVKQ